MTTTPTPVIATQTDLHEAWRRLIHPLGFSRRCLWLMFIDRHGTPRPQLTKLIDLPNRPTAVDVAGLSRFLGHFADDGIRLGVFLGRPGSGAPTEDDRTWADAIYLTGRQVGVTCETVHLGTSTAIIPVPPGRLLDELREAG